MTFHFIRRRQKSIHAMWEMRLMLSCRYELDEAEIVTLLNKSMDQTQNASSTEDGDYNTLVSTERSIRCGRCKRMIE